MPHLPSTPPLSAPCHLCPLRHASACPLRHLCPLHHLSLPSTLPLPALYATSACSPSATSALYATSACPIRHLCTPPLPALCLRHPRPLRHLFFAKHNTSLLPKRNEKKTPRPRRTNRPDTNYDHYLPLEPSQHSTPNRHANYRTYRKPEKKRKTHLAHRQPAGYLLKGCLDFHIDI